MMVTVHRSMGALTAAAIAAIGLIWGGGPNVFGNGEPAASTDSQGSSDGTKKMQVLTLPRKPVRGECFPQRFVAVSASAGRVSLEECAKYPDRIIAMFDERLVVCEKGKYGYCNGKGLIVVKPKFDFADSFSEGLAVVRVSGKYGYIDVNGKTRVQPTLNWAFSFRDGVGAVQSGELWGLINSRGKWIREPFFRRLDVLRGGLYAVAPNGEEGFLDKSGNFARQVSK